MEALIKVEGLSKRYDGFALDDVSFAVEPGRVVGLIGPNGAGKTTILKSLLGIITPDAGTVQLFGADISEMDAKADVLKQRIGVVFDTCAFLSTMRIRDVASLGRAAYKHWDQALFDEYCRQFNLEGKKYVKSLSRGMGMKLTLSFALSHHPDLLILDEATAGLDPMARDEILDILRAFMEDDSRGILMATHITTDLEKIADEVVCIDDGRILFIVSKETICDQAGIAHCRTSDVEKIRMSENFSSEGFRLMQRGLGIDVLVPDRFAFASIFPDIAIERASIEDYMTLTLKGEAL